MPLHQRIKYASSIIFLIGIAALFFIKLHNSPGDSLFSSFVPTHDGKIWTVIGSANSSKEAYVGLDGAVQPGVDAYAVHWYVYDTSSHSLLNSNNAKRSLLNGYLPAPIVKWSDRDVDAQIMSFVDDESNTCYSSLSLKNLNDKNRKLKVFIAVLPYGVTGKMQICKSIEYDQRLRTLKTGCTEIVCDQTPDGFGAVELSKRSDGKFIDITSFIINGTLPRYRKIVSHSKMPTVSGAIGYEIGIKPGCTRTISFRTPVGFGREVSRNNSCIKNYSTALGKFKDQWHSRLDRVKVSLPDKRFSDCFYASLAYLMILSDDGAPRPGSAVYEPFWVRDNAYIADAYYYAGRSDLAKQSLDQLLKLQRNDGGFAPTSAGLGNSEHDAHGEAIYTFVQHYRRTKDATYLKKVWPRIESAAKYIDALRHGQGDYDNSILPPSMSAEDLGSEKQQHYWDDFWAIRGLRDASFAAKTLGRQQDAARLEEQAESLTNATWSSIRKLAKDHSIRYIPNGPQDITSSAMARGTSCGLWPCDVLDPLDPFVKSSFDIYWKKWIEGHNGGFEHKNEYWPYAGLDLAMDYLMLGQYERSASILRWSIYHDPTGGFYSWPEGMNIKNHTLAAGDMPHGWMCAAYINLIRNMLVRESGSDLYIASGVPREWLLPGKKIEVKDLPTVNGPVSYRLRAYKNNLNLSIEASGAGNCQLILPNSIKILELNADGRELKSFSGNRCSFPGSAKEIVLKVKR